MLIFHIISANILFSKQNINLPKMLFPKRITWQAYTNLQNSLKTLMFSRLLFFCFSLLRLKFSSFMGLNLFRSDNLSFCLCFSIKMCKIGDKNHLSKNTWEYSIFFRIRKTSTTLDFLLFLLSLFPSQIFQLLPRQSVTSPALWVSWDLTLLWTSGLPLTFVRLFPARLCSLLTSVLPLTDHCRLSNHPCCRMIDYWSSFPAGSRLSRRLICDRRFSLLPQPRWRSDLDVSVGFRFSFRSMGLPPLRLW